MFSDAENPSALAPLHGALTVGFKGLVGHMP